MSKFNPGPIFAALICCVWPIIFHLAINHWRDWFAHIANMRGSLGKKIRIGGK